MLKKPLNIRNRDVPGPIDFQVLPFHPFAWERERIHRYSVRAPRWWHAWKRLQT